MRVLMLTWEYPPHLVGGMGKHVADLVPTLDAAGVTVDVVTPALRGGAPEEAIGTRSRLWRVQTPVMPEYGFVPFTQETNRALEAFAHQLAVDYGPFDLIHGHDWLTAYATVNLKYAWRAPLITTIHATERGRGRGFTNGEQAQIINGTEWWLAYESWRVVVCSVFMAQQVQQYFDTPPDKITVIPNGVHPPTLDCTLDERQEFRRQFAHDDERLVFTVARLVHEKGVHVLIEAIPLILAARHDVKFVIAGTGHLLDWLQARTRELGIEQRVFFTGFIPNDERDHLYTVADVAVFPSLYEPFGIVALEAMAARCPVVVSDTGGLHEVVNLHETGIAVYPDNPTSLAWGILHTLNHPDWAAKRAHKAFELTRSMYNWHTIAQQTIDLYRQVLEEKQISMWGPVREIPHGDS